MNRTLIAGLGIAALSLTLLIAETLAGRVLSDAVSMGLHDGPVSSPASSAGGGSR